jgi:hypothetical protein
MSHQLTGPRSKTTFAWQGSGAYSTLAAAQAAVEGIAAMQQHHTTVYALQQLHAATGA